MLITTSAASAPTHTAAANAETQGALIDATGTLRYVKFGEGEEGDYAHTESLIRKLLVTANADVALPPATEPTTG